MISQTFQSCIPAPTKINLKLQSKRWQHLRVQQGTVERSALFAKDGHTLFYPSPNQPNNIFFFVPFQSLGHWPHWGSDPSSSGRALGPSSPDQLHPRSGASVPGVAMDQGIILRPFSSPCLVRSAVDTRSGRGGGSGCLVKGRKNRMFEAKTLGKERVKSQTMDRKVVVNDQISKLTLLGELFETIKH